MVPLNANAVSRKYTGHIPVGPAASLDSESSIAGFGMSTLDKDSTVKAILKMRPLALSIFEKHNIDPWPDIHTTVGSLCQKHKYLWSVFQSEFSGLVVPCSATDWKPLPAYHLLDFLREEHREFLLVILPSITEALESAVRTSARLHPQARALAQEWPAFVSSLTEHIREEEIFLFPKILRYDYCLRHGNADPDFAGGSVNVFIAIRGLGNEHRQSESIRIFLDPVRIDHLKTESPEMLDAALLEKLECLGEKLKSHSRLESDALYPLATKTEKALLDARIAGSRYKVS